MPVPWQLLLPLLSSPTDARQTGCPCTLSGSTPSLTAALVFACNVAANSQPRSQSAGLLQATQRWTRPPPDASRHGQILLHAAMRMNLNEQHHSSCRRLDED